MHKLDHRKDIEGLRAIAILLVIAAHAKIPWFQGGFIGVDIFFVISGFLITRMLVNEISNTGHIHFLDFYARRLKRLLPTLILVIGITALALYFLLQPIDHLAQAKAGAAASLWLSNIYFSFTTFDYFGAQADSNAFLHTWSLGVEEQFYLIWPALIFATWAVHKSINYLKFYLIILTLVSFYYCVSISKSNPDLAFYLMPLRAWQFAIGALVCIVSEKTLTIKKFYSHTIIWSGTGIIAISAVTLGNNITYPSFWALLPTAATAMLIFIGSTNATHIVNKLLISPPLQLIGKTSYAWYLWHWPILIIGNILLPQISIGETLFLIFLSWILAAATFYYFENPIRHWDICPSRPGWKIIVAIFVMIVANSSFIRWHNHTLNNFDTIAPSPYLKATIDAPEIYMMGCDDWYHSAALKPCYFGERNANKTAVIIGDSIGLQWFPALKEIFLTSGWQLVVLTKSACPMIEDTIFYKRLGREYTECTQWKDSAIKEIARIRPNAIIMRSAEGYDIKPNIWNNGSKKFFSQITHSTDWIYVIRATPELSFNGPKCLNENRFVNERRLKSACKSKIENDRNSSTWDAIRNASYDFKNIKTIDMNSIVCPNNICAAQKNDVIVFRDQQHLTATFVTNTQQELYRFFESLLTHDTINH